MNFDIVTGIEFARAIAAHFKLPGHTQADMQLNTGVDEIFGVTITIPLSADDLAAVANLMVGRTAVADVRHAAEVMGFDAWMRARVESAHLEMMAHAGRRGGA